VSLPPIGFWSYTRDDDAASGRRLSGLLESLQAQLKQKLGKLEVRVFQDVAAIPPGTEWQTQIESALREASFLIPIITPALLHSPNCAEEIRYFRTLMEARGRKDLILPICFTDVSLFNTVREKEIHDPALFDYLKTLHWVDFTDVETKGLDRPEMRERLRAFATRIEETLYRVPPEIVRETRVDPPDDPSPPPPGSQRNEQIASGSGNQTIEPGTTDGKGASSASSQPSGPVKSGFTAATWAMSVGLVVLGIAIGTWGLPSLIAHFSRVEEEDISGPWHQTQASTLTPSSQSTAEPSVAAMPEAQKPTAPAPATAPAPIVPPLATATPPPATARPIPRCAVCPEMVLIPGGTFKMGDTALSNAWPVTDMKIEPFLMAKYPITVGEYRAFLTANPTFQAGNAWKDKAKDPAARLPAVNVNHKDALAYIGWLNHTIRPRIEAGQETAYRLPSEAEWEYAARAGSPDAYFWGDRFEDGARFVPPRHKGLVPAETLDPNKFQLHGMLGLVWNWTADPWHPDYKERSRDGSVWTTGGDPVRRVQRGGSWNNDPWLIGAGVRSRGDDVGRHSIVGFRLAKTSLTP
jgi:formylglycine-generating enzyme required for sulfatase activity